MNNLENSETTTDFLISQASETTMLFSKIYSGIRMSVVEEDRPQCLRAAVELTKSIIQNIPYLSDEVEEF